MVFEDNKKQILVLLAGLAIALFMVVGIWWVLSDGKEVLFTNLTEAEINRVAAELDRSGVSYFIDHHEGVVSVGQSDVHKARISVMESGVAFDEVHGFELFNESDFGMTEFAQKINFQRALEGELSRTIMALKEVKYCRVHLVLPDSGLFAQDDKKSSASVTLFLHQGEDLSGSQIAGIQRIVAASVRKMDSTSVVVTNSAGVVLSRDRDDDFSSVTSLGLERKEEIESHYLTKLQTLLDAALGADNYIVNIDVQLDMKQTSTRRETYLPEADGSVVKNRKTTQRTSADKAGSRDTVEEVELLVGRQTDQVQYLGGEVARIHLSVMVNDAADSTELQGLEQLIATTVGLNTDRGDRLAVFRHNLAVNKATVAARTELEHPVRSVAMDAEMDTAPLAAKNWLERTQANPEGLIPTVAAAFGGFAAGGLLLFVSMGSLRRNREKQQLQRELVAWADSIEGKLDAA